MHKSFLEDLKEFQHLLFVAVANILGRWWEDSEADFPRRMPLAAHEESVLKVWPLSCFSRCRKPYNNRHV
ncbi:uncharacterized protein BDV17DRAFT_253789 [Aspergillus undulatus]|uniref:uncharacterized protein n=1 Tax=Aspergillus undulatus TaxID=1810928 RepID=UPI003CCD13E0